MDVPSLYTWRKQTGQVQKKFKTAQDSPDHIGAERSETGICLTPLQSTCGSTCMTITHQATQYHHWKAMSSWWFTVIERLQLFCQFRPFQNVLRVVCTHLCVILVEMCCNTDSRFLIYFGPCCFILWMHFVRRKGFLFHHFCRNFSLDTGCQHTLTGHLMYKISSEVDFLLKHQPYLSALCDHHFAASVSWQVTIKLDDDIYKLFVSFR